MPVDQNDVDADESVQWQWPHEKQQVSQHAAPRVVKNPRHPMLHSWQDPAMADALLLACSNSTQAAHQQQQNTKVCPSQLPFKDYIPGVWWPSELTQDNIQARFGAFSCFIGLRLPWAGGGTRSSSCTRLEVQPQATPCCLHLAE